VELVQSLYTDVSDFKPSWLNLAIARGIGAQIY
jgi:hypothetical protein